MNVLCFIGPDFDDVKNENSEKMNKSECKL